MKSVLRIPGTIVIIPFAVLLLANVALCQQEYPAKPVNMVHGYTAGGGTDMSVRIVCEALGKNLKQPFLTVSKPGGGQSIAVSFVARSAPDGYTVGHFYQSVFTIVAAMQEVPFKLEDLTPVLGWQMAPNFLVCRPDAPYKNLKELVEYAKSHTVNFGHNGRGGATYLTPVYFSKQAGIKLTDVPFKGDSDQIPALLGGHINLASVTAVAAGSLMEAGKVRALVTYAKKRSEFHPAVPTFEEQGFESIGVPILMTFVPKGTPEGIVKKIHDVIRAATNERGVKEEFNKVKMALTYVPAKDIPEIIAKEKATCYPILKEAGVAK